MTKDKYRCHFQRKSNSFSIRTTGRIKFVIVLFNKSSHASGLLNCKWFRSIEKSSKCKKNQVFETVTFVTVTAVGLHPPQPLKTTVCVERSSVLFSNSLKCSLLCRITYFTLGFPDLKQLSSNNRLKNPKRSNNTVSHFSRLFVSHNH